MSVSRDRIVFGTVQLGLPYGRGKNREVIPLGEAERLLATVWELGVQSFDTAAAYGCAAIRLADWLAKTGRLQDATVVTKVHPDECQIPEKVKEAISLFQGAKNLVVLTHGAVDAGGWENFSKICRKSEINSGQSVYTAEEVESAFRLGAGLVQAPGNLLDLRQIHQARVLDKPLDVRSVFLQGLLLDEPEMAEKRVEGSGLLAKAIQETCLEFDLPPAQALIQATLHLAGDKCRVVLGADSAEEVAAWKLASGPDEDTLNAFYSAVREKIKTQVAGHILDPRKWKK